MAHILRFIISSGSKKKKPSYACLSEAKASHAHKMWTQFHISYKWDYYSTPLRIDVFSGCYVR